MTFGHMYCSGPVASSAPNPGVSTAFTVRVNGFATGAICFYGVGAATGVWPISLGVIAGQRLEVQVDNPGNGTGQVTWALGP